MPGPLPKPTALKVLEGNPGKRPLNTNEPRPPAEAPEAPQWLDTEALAEWNRVVPSLDALGLLTAVDRAALTAYCLAWSLLVGAQVEIVENGIMVYGQKGERVKNPAIQVQRDATATIKGFCAEFGLTPSARGRMSVPGSDEPDGLIEGLLS
jgi:P27 family predicted phage terminase small subunit